MSGALDYDGRLLAVLARAHNQLADVDGELSYTVESGATRARS
jgi:hypothetical protein